MLDMEELGYFIYMQQEEEKKAAAELEKVNEESENLLEWESCRKRQESK